MKVSEVHLGEYDYVRIAVLRHSGPEYCAAGAEDYVLRAYGNAELAEDGVANADGWLTLKLAETVKKEEKQ